MSILTPPVPGTGDRLPGPRAGTACRDRVSISRQSFEVWWESRTWNHFELVDVE